MTTLVRPIQNQPLGIPNNKGMSRAPVCLFVYNRPFHTRKAVEALLKNELASESELHIYSDAPKTSKAASAVRQVRDYIRHIRGFKSLTIVERDKNIGLAQSIISGVTTVCDQYSKVIVLEDDLVTSPFFLRYMNDALDIYEHAETVFSIHGYMFPVAGNLPDTFFLRGANSWGWATWSRAWRLFEADGAKLLAELCNREMTHQFNLDGSYPYTEMLQNQIAGKNDSWAIRWRASVFLAGGLTLFPGKSLVQNIGHDASGVHCVESDACDVELATTPTNVVPIPQEECGEALAALILYFRGQQRGLLTRASMRLRRILKQWQRLLLAVFN